MTTDEFDREFDILYNNIASNAAPSIDLYEKSVFLTKAQEEIVIALYNGSFEANEQLIESLDELVDTKSYNSIQNSETYPEKLSKDSIVFKLDPNILFIVYESLTLNNEDKCGNKINVLVKPTRHDEYYRISRNPFRKPRNREALRLNIGNDLIEIIYPNHDYTYQVRYIRKPKPIMLYDVGYNGTDLTINGIKPGTNPIECELDSSIHRTILERAVALATATYNIHSSSSSKDED